MRKFKKTLATKGSKVNERDALPQKMDRKFDNKTRLLNEIINVSFEQFIDK
jgi:hypothetical protein